MHFFDSFTEAYLAILGQLKDEYDFDIRKEIRK